MFIPNKYNVCIIFRIDIYVKIHFKNKVFQIGFTCFINEGYGR